MDIRNIALELSQEAKIKPLEIIFDLGRDQFNKYRLIEGLPDYPFNLNPKKNQYILKDFIGRVVEEITECYESYLEFYNVSSSIGFNLTYKCSPDIRTKLLNSLQNANEEVADAIGFFIPLFLYSNVDNFDIVDYVKLKYSKLGLVIDNNTLNSCMSYGIKLLKESDDNSINTEYRNYYMFDTHDEPSRYNLITPLFHFVSPDLLQENILQWWQIVYQLNYARNLLKNRPWKVNETMTKEVDFQEALVKAFLMFLGNLAYNGGDPYKVYTLFHHKQALNLWRIKTGY